MSQKILLVDDEQDLVEMLSFRLEASGYDVSTACNGRDGIEKAKSLKPDMILLDLMMPEMDGFQVAETLKADSATKNIPIIVFTAAVGKDLEEHVADMGAVDCVTKPFEPADLITKVKKALK